MTKFTNVANHLQVNLGFTPLCMVDELKIIREKTIAGYNDNDYVEDLKGSMQAINYLIEFYKDID